MTLRNENERKTACLVILSLVPRLSLQGDVADVGTVFFWGYNETQRNEDRLAMPRAGWFLYRSSWFYRMPFPKSHKTWDALLMQRSGLTCVTMAPGSLRLSHRVLSITRRREGGKGAQGMKFFFGVLSLNSLSKRYPAMGTHSRYGGTFVLFVPPR